MKTEKEIRDQIEKIKQAYHHVLYVGSPATIAINAPRALMQLAALSKLEALYYVLGERYLHKWAKPTPDS